MSQKFYWTARLIQDGKIIQSKYFASQEKRNQFVLENNEWKKRGKICVNNLEKHLLEEINSDFIE